MNIESPTEESPDVDHNKEPKNLMLAFANREFNVMVEFGSVVSRVTKKMTEDIGCNDSKAWRSRRPNPTKLKIFNISPIRNISTLYCDVSSQRIERKTIAPHNCT